MVDHEDEPRRAGRSGQSRQRRRASVVSPDEDADGDLGELMGEVARALQEEHRDVEATLAAITAAAVGSVPGADECTLSYVTGRRRVEPRAATGDMAQVVDEVQDRLQEGPCLDAVWEQRTVRVDDMTTETRWPRFAAAAAELGVRSSLSVQVFVRDGNLGALNTYSRSAHAFTEQSEDVALVFAAHAGVALAGARAEENLRTAVSSRDLIGQAKGILMERFRLTADQSFLLLTEVSQSTHRRVVDVARELAETGTVPGLAARQQQ